jgi:alpha-aminoadipate/glutamate carrier protein LysW
MSECPECGGNVQVAESVEKGELLQCNECGVELEVTAADPLTLEKAPEAEEDWGE